MRILRLKLFRLSNSLSCYTCLCFFVGLFSPVSVLSLLHSEFCSFSSCSNDSIVIVITTIYPPCQREYQRSSCKCSPSVLCRSVLCWHLSSFFFFSFFCLFCVTLYRLIYTLIVYVLSSGFLRFFFFLVFNFFWVLMLTIIFTGV